MSWVVKHTPKVWQDLLLPNAYVYRKQIETLFETGQFPYYGILVHGRGGSGKTTFLDILAGQPRWQVYQLKESGETKKALDDLNYALSMVPFADKHLVIGNEISESTKDFRNGLRSIIDKHNHHAFFAFSDNDVSKLKQENPQVFDDERIKSISWDIVSDEELEKICFTVLDKEGVLTPKNKELAQTLVQQNKPSIRKILQTLEFNHNKE
jgi:hypothetical protein